MGLLNWIEQKMFLGEIIKDYGVIEERQESIRNIKVSLLLCRRKDQVVLVIKQSMSALLAASVSYNYINTRNLPQVKTIIDDAQQHISGG